MEFNGEEWKLLWTATTPIPQALKARVLKIQKPKHKTTLHSLLELHRDIGNWHALAIKKWLRGKKSVDLIASHGQTVAHFPPPDLGMTFQLGDPTRIAYQTGITVACDFRSGDLATGGQGAPLVPLFLRTLADQTAPGGKHIAFLNLGGIANFTDCAPGGFAFDTGPGNIWIDQATFLATRGKKSFDQNGTLASQGTPDPKAMQKLFKLPYFSLKPPKSTGRDDFPFEIFLKKTKAKNVDLIATATQFTAESVARAAKTWLTAKSSTYEIWVTGGGTENSTLMKLLKKNCAPIPVKKCSHPKLTPQFIEAAAFAYLGYRTVLGKSCGGHFTGGDPEGPPGHLVPGKNWRKILG